MSTGETINLILIGLLCCITIYYAWQTHKQAILLRTQLAIIRDQREKSIAPVLQISNIGYIDQIFWLGNRKLLTPNLSLVINNVGGGPALDLEILVEAVLLIQNSEDLSEKYVKMTWHTYVESEEIYVAAHSTKPIKLVLITVQPMNSHDSNHEMIIAINCNNMDYQSCNETKKIISNKKLSKMIIGDYPGCTKPGDDDFPKDIELHVI